MNHEGDIECIAEIGVFGECGCPCCRRTGKTARGMAEQRRELTRVRERMEEARRQRDLFSALSIYRQIKERNK